MLKNIHIFEGPDRSGKSTACRDFGIAVDPVAKNLMKKLKAKGFQSLGLMDEIHRLEFAAALTNKQNSIAIDRSFVSSWVYPLVRKLSRRGDCTEYFTRELHMFNYMCDDRFITNLHFHFLNVTSFKQQQRGSKIDSFEQKNFEDISARFNEAVKSLVELSVSDKFDHINIRVYTELKKEW